MAANFLSVLGYAGVGILFGVLVLMLDWLLLGLANRFANLSDEYAHRIGTQLPRILN